MLSGAKPIGVEVAISHYGAHPLTEDGIFVYFSTCRHPLYLIYN